MKRTFKYLIPMLLMCSLSSCGNTPTTSRPSTTPVTTPTTPVNPPSTTPTTPETPVNLAVDFTGLTENQKPTMSNDWTTDFTYSYNKSIVLKKTTDFIMTPPFKTSKALDVKVTGYLEKGSTSDGKLVIVVEGLGKNKEVVETVEIKESEVKGTMETPSEFVVTLKNSAKNINQIKIGIKTVGRSTNFGINKLVVTSK